MRTAPLHRSIARRLERQAGLTLVEIIVVLVILASLMYFLTGGLFKQAEGARVKMTEMQLEKLKSAINQYRLMNNALPPNLEAMVNCSGQTGRACVPVAQEEDLKDAWGTPFVYSIEGSGRSYRIKSVGADARDGGSGVDGDIIKEGP
ncbi:MAG: type II secretion system protein GspG [Deltaproteobacteria bacterium]|nr:type II secretion system protein GspG [Deltaproteobacteria bacterium]